MRWGCVHTRRGRRLRELGFGLGGGAEDMGVCVDCGAPALVCGPVVGTAGGEWMYAS